MTCCLLAAQEATIGGCTRRGSYSTAERLVAAVLQESQDDREVVLLSLGRLERELELSALLWA
jgi:hypothetical protein